jgi:hypothetical protein
VAIAFAPIFVRVSEVGPLATAFWRLLLAWPALWVWIALERHRRPALRQPSRFLDYLRLAVAGLVMALLGATLIVGASFQIRLQQVGGDLLALTLSFFYAGYLLSITRLRRDFSTAAIMTWSTAGCTVILLLVTLLSGERFFASSASGWLVLGGLALVSQVAGQGLIADALAHLPTAFSSVILLLQSVYKAGPTAKSFNNS